jgi:two-component system KDP operon response regulator KdpE
MSQTVDLATYEVKREDGAVDLTPQGSRPLAALIKGNGNVLTHRQRLLEV